MYTLKVSLHCRLDHPSNEAIRQVKQNTSGLPGLLRWSIVVSVILQKRLLDKPSSIPLGFQISQFQKIPIFVLVVLKANNLNDPSLRPPCTPNMALSLSTWTLSPSQPNHTPLLHAKSAALTATCQFLQMVKTQFQASIQDWKSDFSGEYKSATYDDLLKGKGIRVYNSAPMYLNKTDM